MSNSDAAGRFARTGRTARGGTSRSQASARGGSAGLSPWGTLNDREQTVPTRQGGGYGLPRRGAGDGGADGTGGGGRRGPRRKGSWWRRWTWKKALGLVAAIIGVLIILMAVGIAYAYSRASIPTNIEQSALNQASTVYFNDGKTVVGKFGTTDRQPLTYSQIPPLVRNAVVAAEDKNFWHEGGISPSGILRAAYNDLFGSGNLQGGSTITQQLVRNYYVGIGTEQTLSRKIKEIFVATKLAKAKPKWWILTQYLNTVYFGDSAYGIGAAAQTYFGVAPTHLSKLTAGQAAMLAAMIQSPGYYTPNPKGGAGYQALVWRWRNYVLPTMASLGFISQQAARAAEQHFPTVVRQSNVGWSGYRGYIMQRVRYELETMYGYTQSQIDNEGLRIDTTVSKKLMDSLYAAVQSNESLMRHCAAPAFVSAARPACTGLPRYVHVGALLERPRDGAILAMYSGKNYNSSRPGSKYDNALQSRNQVGSSFKPYVLATAVKMGMNVQTSLLNGDSPLWIPLYSQPNVFASTKPPAPGSGWYEVSNDESGNNNFGPVHVELATAASLNTAYADLWHRVAYSNGQYNVVNMAKAFGVDVSSYAGGGSGLASMAQQAGTALGQASLTVQEQATMIATLADHGTWNTPHMIAKIARTTQWGTTLVTNAKVATHQVLTPAQAADVDWAMSFDTTSGGTAAGLGLTNGQTVIAKTGTTNLSQSAFFLGATQRYAMAVGMFVTHPGCTLPASQQYLCQSTSALAYAPPKGLQTLFGVGGFSGYGGQWPALIWHTFFMKNFNRLPVQAWPQPNNNGTMWDLAGNLPKPGAHHHKPVPGCHGNGDSQGCDTPTPTPTATVTPTGTPTPSPTSTCQQTPLSCHSPTPTPSHTGHGHGGGAASAGALLAAPLLMLLIVMAGPSLPLVRRRLRRRRAPVTRD